MVALFSVTFLPEILLDDYPNNNLSETIMEGVGFNPFMNIVSLVIVVGSIALSGLVIYLMDKSILTKAGLDVNRAKSSALKLALITAPYLYLFPSSLLYSGGL